MASLPTLFTVNVTKESCFVWANSFIFFFTIKLTTYSSTGRVMTVNNIDRSISMAPEWPLTGL